MPDPVLFAEVLAESLKSPAPIEQQIRQPQPAAAPLTPAQKLSKQLKPATLFTQRQLPPLNSPTPLPPGTPPLPTSTPIILPPTPVTPPTSPLPDAIAPLNQDGVVELKADEQSYDQRRQVFTASGKVYMKFRDSVLTADRIQVNLLNRFAVAEGNVMLTKGAQVLQGDRFEYNFVQGEGRIQGIRGEIGTRTAEQDFAPAPSVLPSDISAVSQISRPVSDRIYRNQPPTQIDSKTGADLTLGNPFGQTGTGGEGFRRLRFEAGEAEFFTDGWIAKDIRITNDPFSPPELELRAKNARSKKITPTEDEILLDQPRLVFDQGFSLPIPRNRIVLNQKEDNPWVVYPGFDSGDRGGFFVERSFVVFRSPSFYLGVTPEFYAQRALSSSNLNDWFGIRGTLAIQVGRARLFSTAELTSLDIQKFDKRFRANLQLVQPIGTHTLALQGSYRNRLFNNSLGFQDVQSSIGGIFYSPNIVLGNTGINLSYQAGYQYINADTDRLSLLPAVRSNNRVSLHRYQASAALSKSFRLWTGQPLPATQTEGLRYSPRPIVPYLDFAVGTTGVATGYSSGDRQNNLTFSAGFNAQFGHFSKPMFDYTALNITYSQVFQDGLSPFLFDRIADSRVVFAGITQQIYGPWRAGIQTAWNVASAREISTDYFIEYSRRTYNVRLRYNPVLSLGSLSLIINDFNWGGGSEPFDANNITPVNSGVLRP